MREFEISLRPHNAVAVVTSAMAILSGIRSFDEYPDFLRHSPPKHNDRVIDLTIEVVRKLIDNPHQSIRIVPNGDIQADILCARCKHQDRESHDPIGVFLQDVFGGLGFKPGMYTGEDLFRMIAKRKHFITFVDEQGVLRW